MPSCQVRARLTVLLACTLALTPALHGHAQTRARGGTIWDREQDRLQAEAVRRARSASSIVPVIEIGSNWEHAPTRTLAILHAIGADRRFLPSVRVYARSYERVLLRRSGQHEASTTLLDALGYVRAWRMLGPFDNEGKRGFDTVMPPETTLDQATDVAAEVEGAERPIHWRTLPDLGDTDTVELGPFLTPGVDVCAFAETWVELDRAGPLSVWAGASGAVRVWWNGSEVIEDSVYRTLDIERDAALVDGRAGWNRVLVKVCGASGGANFVLRVAAPDGSPMTVHADPAGATLPAAATAVTSHGTAPMTMLAALEADVTAHPDDAAAHEALARYLGYTGGSDPSEHRVRDLATRATELHATAQNLLFAALQQATRADRSRLVLQAVALAPNDPDVQLAHATLVRDGAGGERALAMLEAIPDTTRAGLVALTTRAHLLGALGLGESAHAIYESLDARVPGTPWYLRMLVESEEARGHADRALELRRRLLALHVEDADSRRALADDALARSDHALATQLVQDELTLSPTSSATMSWAASIYDALGMESEAVAVLSAATDLDPDEADTRVGLGQLLLRLGRRDAALASLREALALRPQDANTRMLIEQIEPEARPDEAYATAIDEILTRRRPDGEWPASILHDLEVRTVHESGLSSTFRQVVTQIHDDEGARAYRSAAIFYEPSTQWVDVRAARVHRNGQVLSSFRLGQRSLAEPQYRIYYSAREVIVTFPLLEPGDVIELRYRVEDVAARNAFADYFGTIRGLAAGIPTVRIEDIFLTPTSRHLYFNTPSIPVAHEESTEGTTHVERFVAADVPAMHAEPLMPGYAEVAPYLHASTYRTWDEVGRFWWGLARDQLTPDAALERTVHELVDDAPDLRTKVARIYAWATDHVRYVGLEFGIHGHQPYRVTDVVQRGFGDCKDTASLLYAMLRIAGIDARIALVRTTRNGEIGDQPASLAVFDHAIAYVPALDMFLDGTAEHTGLGEVPQMDQGALALVVGPDSAELRHIPVGGADASGRRRELTITLGPDGSGDLTATEELRGSDATSARGRYDSPETRATRLGQALGALFPGFEIGTEAFSTLGDREVPVRYTWTGHVAAMGERDGPSIRIAPSTVGGLTQAWAPLATRRHTLVLGPGFHHRERRVIAAGALSIEDVPAGGIAESEFGRLSITFVQTGRTVTTETELLLTQGRVTVEDYPAFRAWCQAADALLHSRVTFGGVR
jgi:transglutaminase-like putative cysteine protease/tetratricopeptide (TPR) repeat protein